MAQYSIRVELKGDPPAEKYEELHALMGRMGFEQTVTGVDSHGNNKEFPLPHATYFGSSNDACSSVRDAVSGSVKAIIQKEIVVFVVDVGTWAISY
jgi:hypothetical protein